MDAELVMLLANEKTFRDRDSGFVEILSYQIITSFLYHFPQFTCVFFVHNSPILVLSPNDLVYDLVYPTKSYNQDP